MRVASVEVEGRHRWGPVYGPTLRDASDLAPTLRAFLAAGGTTVELAAHRGRPIELDSARLLAPVPNPSKIWCTGLNFDDYRRQLGLDFLKAPNVFLKAPSALTGHDAVVAVPAGYGSVFHEWELTAIVGRRLRDASETAARAAIFGYTILDDLTLHDVELANREHQQWAKNPDGFAPCGPWIVTSDELDPARGLTMRRWRNGRLEQESSTTQMRFQHPELIEFISSFSTLECGDLVTAGTPPAGPCGPGDVIDGEVEGIGTLRVRLAKRRANPRWQAVVSP
jgi:acylpyruvate hydrolase